MNKLAAYDRMITFVSVHHSIQAEQILLAGKLDVEAIPTPRQVDVSCGQSLLFFASEEQAVMACIRNANIRWGKLFSRSNSGLVYEKIMDNGE